MSEPELPGIPPTPKAPLRERLLSPRKWPGWASLGLGSSRIFHLWEDLDFAFNALRALGGELGMIATVIASPFFAVGLIAYGVFHLIFVGEPRQALRHHAWTYVGWAVFGICFTAVVVTAGWGAVQAYITSKVSHAVEDRFWHLTDVQQSALGMELDKIPPDQRFLVDMHVVQGNPQALTLGEDLAATFQRHQWQVTGAQDLSLRADLIGINFVVAMDFPRADKDMPPHVMELADIFRRAGIKYGGAWQPRFDNNSLLLVIGSRPPDW